MTRYRRLRSGLHRFLAFPLLRARREHAAPSPTEGELLFELAGENPGNRLFGRDGEQEVISRLARAGILPGLARRGYPSPLLVLDCRDPSDQRVCLYADRRSRDRLLFEVRLQIGLFSPRRPIGPLTEGSTFRMLIIHWLVLSDPDRPFSAARPRLPGQELPGLGLLSSGIALLRDIAREFVLDGALDIPRYFHTAVFLSRDLRFLDPEDEGRFRALARDLASVPLATASEAVAEGCLIDAGAGDPRRWSPSEQVLPVRDSLRRYFRSAWYRDRRDRAAAGVRYAVDWGAYRAKIAASARPGKYP
jgi:hypothetical protein